jgi:hypothetical protein
MGIEEHQSNTQKLQKLEESKQITLKSDNKKTLVTIVNYEAYQGDMGIEEHQSNTKVTSKEHQSNTDKNIRTKEVIGWFEEIWKTYPNRKGRPEAYKHFVATVKDSETFQKIQGALGYYLQSGSVKKGYVQNGSTWFNQWRDWVEPSSVMMRGNGQTKYEKKEPMGAIELLRLEEEQQRGN